jgi:N-methylhydantoinase A
MNPSSALRIAVDIGGTFTDVVLQRGTQQSSTKLLTTPKAPEKAMVEGILQVLAQVGAAPHDVDLLVHGTTLATNALIERKGARTGFITNAGFRDVLAMGDEKRFDHYDLDLEKPSALIPRQARIGVKGRMTAQGKAYEPICLDEVDQAIASLKSQAIEAVAVGMLHAYANPEHERAIADRVRTLWPEASVCISSEVCPEIREFERFSTTVANAYVQPLMSRYLQALQERLQALGLRCPLFLVTSGGGLTTLQTAMRFPIRLVESGPAGGATLSASLSHQLGLKQSLSFDMGGTTAKICFITDGQVEQSRRFEVARAWKNLKGSGWPVRIPVTEMVEIGAGGGSIGRVDRMGRIAVGPDSAAALPGPVCFGRGGQLATVTDAQLVLGRLDPQRFAAGRLQLDLGAAQQAIAEQVARAQSLDLTWAAGGILEIVEENMANAARVHAIERGKTLAQCALIAFGGAAPLHAAAMARRLGIHEVVVPKDAGVGSAVGFLLSPVAFEMVRSLRMQEAWLDLPRLNEMLRDLEEQSTHIVRLGDSGARIQVRRWVDVRYAGQGHELGIELPEGPLEDRAIQHLRAAFESRYERQYGMRIPGVALEFLTWTVSASAQAPVLPALPNAPEPTLAQPQARRQVFDAQTGQWLIHPVYDRTALAVGAWLDGPALVVEEQTTTVVPPGWRASLDGLGHLHLIDRTASSTPSTP